MELLQKAMIAMVAPTTIWAIAKALEDAASKTARTTLTTWLKGSKFAEDLTSPLQAFLLNIFYEFFSRNSRTWKFVRRVLVCSIAAVTLFWLISFSVLVVYFAQNVDAYPNAPHVDKELALYLMVAFAITVGGVLVSFPCDYLSVIKSLALLKLAEAEKKFQFYWIVDFAISLMMGVSWLFFTFTLVAVIDKYLVNPDIIWPIETMMFAPIAVVSISSVAVTSLAPTLMLLVVTVAGYVARTVFRLTKPFDFLRQRVLHIDEKPFLALGLLLAIPVYLVMLLILLAVG